MIGNEQSEKTSASGPGGIPITIDRKPYRAPKPEMTGAEIRRLADPPIGEDRDLWLAARGPGDDEKIADDQVVRIEPGYRFFSAPRRINPGRARAAR